MTEAIKRLGHTADPSRKADAVIINSCTVTAESDRKTRQLLRRMRSDNSDALIILTGCMVQAFPEKANALGEADIIVGNRDINKIIQLISEYKGEKTTSIDDHRLNDSYIGLPISSFDERTRAFIKIEDGCDRYCSYCIIPKANKWLFKH